jgi:hypothetical protein
LIWSIGARVSAWFAASASFAHIHTHGAVEHRCGRSVVCVVDALPDGSADTGATIHHAPAAEMRRCRRDIAGPA